MKAQTDFARLTLRLPQDLLAQLKAFANENERSINAEVVARLNNSLQLTNKSNPTIEFDRCQINTDDLAAKIATKMQRIKEQHLREK